MLVPDLLAHSARVRRAHTAVTDGRRSFSYGELEQRVARLANVLRDGLGLAPGARFAFLSTNRVEFVEVFFAAAAAGVVCVPLNYRLAPREIAEIMVDAGVEALLVERALEESFAGVAAGFDGRVVWLDDDGAPGSYEALLGQAAAIAPEPRDNEREVVLLMYTSGTTGLPKGVMLSHRNIVSNSWHSLAERLVTSEDRYLSSGPLCHLGAGSRVFLLTHAGATHLIHGRFDPEAAIAAMAGGAANATLIVPAMVRQLLDAAPAGHALRDRVRQITYGTAPMPLDLLAEAVDRLGCDFQQGYGLTEAAPNLTILPAEDHRPGSPGYPARLSSVGRETVGVEVRVLGPSDREVAPDGVGELVARGPNVMEGYWRRPEETAEALRGGWLRTGDLATVDGDGYLYLTDRKKDMLVSGGFNVYPREIERQLEEHPDVGEVAVVGVPDERWGEVPVAFVVAAAGRQLDESALSERLRRFCEPRLARFKQPKVFRVVGELPRNAVGKVVKPKLRAEMKEDMQMPGSSQ